MESEVTEDLFKRLLIIRSKGIGAVRYHELVRDCGGVEAAVDSLSVSGDLMDAVRREMDLADSLCIKYITDDSADFPAIYKGVRNHEPILSARGDVSALRKKTIGMVGTRHATAHGMAFMSNLAKEFARHGFAVVSGMAMGTDGAAHNGALSDSGDAKTVAVLAGGADYVWPKENEKLYWEIIERGCIVSAMPTGYVPIASNFVMRNRIVAGLSEQLIIGEADEKSGAVLTADFMLELGRPLWAVPSHPSDGRGAGPNRFIKEGRAKLCSGASDFFETREKNKKNSETETADAWLMDLIGSVPVSESVLTALAKKNISEIMSALVVLELKGLIEKVDGGYILSR